MNWYHGPTVWDPDPGHMWHADCPDMAGNGRDGEVWLWKDGSASCNGCNTIESPNEGQQ